MLMDGFAWRPKPCDFVKLQIYIKVLIMLVERSMGQQSRAVPSQAKPLAI